jgi:hypothetical protein
VRSMLPGFAKMLLAPPTDVGGEPVPEDEPPL